MPCRLRSGTVPMRSRFESAGDCFIIFLAPPKQRAAWESVHAMVYICGPYSPSATRRYCMIAAARTVLPHFLPITIRTSWNSRMPSSSTHPNTVETMNFWYGMSTSLWPLSPAVWQQNLSMKETALSAASGS